MCVSIYVYVEREVCVYACTYSFYVCKNTWRKEKENSKIAIASDLSFTLGVFWYSILE